MKISISYFYSIRFMKPNQVPVSTAAWDPKWYHHGKDKTFSFLDKNGVVNGSRMEELSPLFLSKECQCCPCKERNPDGCKFLKGYADYLRTLNFSEVMKKLEEYGEYLMKHYQRDEEPEIVLIVYEVPSNPCSERVELIKWFKENGVDLIEWSRS